MVKKICVTALATLLVLPTLSMAGGSGVNIEYLESKIEALSRQLNELKSAMNAQAEANKEIAQNVEDLDESVGELDERSDVWDLASRFNFSGDFRARGDYYTGDTAFGRTLGGQQEESESTGAFYVTWPHAIIDHP